MGVKDDFSSKCKTLKFDCSPGQNPVTDLVIKLITYARSMSMPNFIVIGSEMAPPRGGEIQHQCAFLVYGYMYQSREWVNGSWVKGSNGSLKVYRPTLKVASDFSDNLLNLFLILLIIYTDRCLPSTAI